MLIYAYREFEQRVRKLATMPEAKRETALAALAAYDQVHAFLIAKLERVCPTVSRAAILRVLNELCEQERVECLGAGRWTQWRKL